MSPDEKEISALNSGRYAYRMEKIIVIE